MCLFNLRILFLSVNNSAFDRELLASYSPLCHFWFLLEDNKFVLFLDHKPLTHALFRTFPPWSAMQSSCLSEFNCIITHLRGSKNVVADALSRSDPEIVVSRSSCSISTFQTPPPDAVSTVAAAPLPLVPGISYQDMSALQQSCPKVQALQCSSALTVVSVLFSGSKLCCDLSTGVPPPLFFKTMRRLVFNTIPSVSHPGMRASRRLMSLQRNQHLGLELLRLPAE